MPAPATNDELLALVRKASLVNEAYLNQRLQSIDVSSLPDSPHQLADRLVEAGVLTYYQAVQLLKGKWNKFSIGPYRILERLGFGATSNVYLCENKGTHVRVAVKVLTSIQAQDPTALKRFFREARASTTMEHPNFVRAHDLDWDGQDNFLTMEFVDGSSIQDIIQQFGPMDVRRAAHYISQAALGLHFAYQAGVVHRDIKPGNLMIDRTGQAKILDMGLARFAEEEGGGLTQGEVLGSPEYLSPEQAIDSHKVDSRTDIYSLGGTFYFMVTGKAPYHEEKSSAGKLLSKSLRPPIPVRELVPEVPEEIVAVIDKMMAKNRDERFQTPREVAEALAPWTKDKIAPPPEQEMPQLSPAAITGQGKFGEEVIPVKKKKKVEVEPEGTSWNLVQVVIVVLFALATFFLAWNLLGGP